MLGANSHFLLGGSAPSWPTSPTALRVCSFQGQVTKLTGFKRTCCPNILLIDVEPETQKAVVRTAVPREVGSSAGTRSRPRSPTPRGMPHLLRRLSGKLHACPQGLVGSLHLFSRKHMVLYLTACPRVQNNLPGELKGSHSLLQGRLSFTFRTEESSA